MTFALVEPDSLEEALEALADGDESVRPISGGSGLALMMKYGFFQPTKLVSLRRLAPRLSSVTVGSDGQISLGATTKLRDIEDSPEVTDAVPILHQALRRLATIRLRNVAQIGGAVAHGAPQMDLPPVLLALDASVHVQSREGDRWIPARETFLGYYQTAVAPTELVTEVVVPAQGQHRGTYRKTTARAADDWPLLGVAVVARFKDGRLGEVVAAIGALSDAAQIIPGVGESLSETRPSATDLRDVSEDAADSLEYHEGGMASPRYQRQLVAVNLRRALEEVILGPSEVAHDG